MVKTGLEWSKLVNTGQKQNLTEKSVQTPKIKKIGLNCIIEAYYGMDHNLIQQLNVKVH